MTNWYSEVIPGSSNLKVETIVSNTKTIETVTAPSSKYPDRKRKIAERKISVNGRITVKYRPETDDNICYEFDYIPKIPGYKDGLNFNARFIQNRQVQEVDLFTAQYSISPGYRTLPTNGGFPEAHYTQQNTLLYIGTGDVDLNVQKAALERIRAYYTLPELDQARDQDLLAFLGVTTLKQYEIKPTEGMFALADLLKNKIDVKKLFLNWYNIISSLSNHSVGEYYFYYHLKTRQYMFKSNFLGMGMGLTMIEGTPERKKVDDGYHRPEYYEVSSRSGNIVVDILRGNGTRKTLQVPAKIPDNFISHLRSVDPYIWSALPNTVPRYSFTPVVFS